MKTIRTPKNRANFLDTLVECGGNVSKTCELVCLSKNALYKWRDADPQFAAEWDAAIQRGADVLEDEARRRAVEGVLEPVFYQGQPCGVVRRSSDTLLIFMLKGAKPEKYRDREFAELDRRIVELERLTAQQQQQQQRGDGR